MLILTRRIGETLKIGDDVSLMVLGVQGNQVRIGADAPKHIAIHREEIYRRIQQEKNGGQPLPPKSVKTQPSNTQNHSNRNSNHSPGNSYNSYNSPSSHNTYNSPSSHNSYNSHSGNNTQNPNANNKPFKPREDYNKPYTPRQDYGNQQEPTAENARFYSTEGSAPNKTQKKAPNVIVKKKRVIEGL